MSTDGHLRPLKLLSALLAKISVSNAPLSVSKLR
jgi:hypothetical protein